MRTRQKTILITGLLALAWSGAVAFGLRTLLTYENTPGAAGTVKRTWPTTSTIPRSRDGATLVMLAHPRCPCTGASMSELAEVLAHARGKVTAYVLFLKPSAARDWEETNLQRTAAAIPGVTVLPDPDGTEAKLFGVETSGHTVLFDATGRLIFNGGITASRGHSGDNAGESAIVSLLSGQEPERSETLVFGCSLTARNQKRTSKQCPR